MNSQAQHNKRRVDLACGYTLTAYSALTLYWLSLLLVAELALLFLVMAGVGGLIGLLRSSGLPGRFRIVPLAAIGYAVLIVVLFIFSDQPAGLTIVMGLAGLVLSAACLPITYHLIKNEFGQPLPKWVCHDCGYPLFGLTEPACPECGKAFNLEDVPEMAGPPADR